MPDPILRDYQQDTPRIEMNGGVLQWVTAGRCQFADWPGDKHMPDLVRYVCEKMLPASPPGFRRSDVEIVEDSFGWDIAYTVIDREVTFGIPRVCE